MDVIFFDFDDTLYDQAQPFALAYEEVFGGRFDLDPVALFVASRRHSEAVFEASERGQMPMEDMYIYRIQQAFADFGVHVEGADCLRMQYLYSDNQEHRIAMTPTMCAVLDWCRDNARAGIISNGPAEHQRAKMELCGVERWMVPEAITISSEVGVAKPDPQIFVLACERMGTTPERCLYVGDSFGPDIAGACGAHMPAVWLNRRNHHVPDSPRPDHIVYTEEELLELFKSGACN